MDETPGDTLAQDIEDYPESGREHDETLATLLALEIMRLIDRTGADDILMARALGVLVGGACRGWEKHDQEDCLDAFMAGGDTGYGMGDED